MKMSQVEGACEFEIFNDIQSESNSQQTLLEQHGITGMQQYLTQHEFNIDNLCQLTDNEMKELLHEWSVPVTLRMKTISVIRKLRNILMTATSVNKNTLANTNTNTNIIVLSSLEYDAMDRLSQQQERISSRIKHENTNLNNLRARSKEIENEIDLNVQKAIELIRQLSQNLKMQLKTIVTQKEKSIINVIHQLENSQKMLNEANTKYQTIIADFLTQAQNRDGDGNINNSTMHMLQLNLGVNIASRQSVKVREQTIVKMVDNVVNNTTAACALTVRSGKKNKVINKYSSNYKNRRGCNNNSNNTSNNSGIVFNFNFESLQTAIENCASISSIGCNESSIQDSKITLEFGKKDQLSTGNIVLGQQKSNSNSTYHMRCRNAKKCKIQSPTLARARSVLDNIHQTTTSCTLLLYSLMARLVSKNDTSGSKQWRTMLETMYEFDLVLEFFSNVANICIQNGRLGRAAETFVRECATLWQMPDPQLDEALLGNDLSEEFVENIQKYWHKLRPDLSDSQRRIYSNVLKNGVIIHGIFATSQDGLSDEQYANAKKMARKLGLKDSCVKKHLEILQADKELTLLCKAKFLRNIK